MPAPARDKRSEQRIPVLGDLHGEISVFERMAIREIGRFGAQIETAVPLQLNSLHHLRLSLGETSIVVRGRIVHSRVSEVAHGETRYRSGVEFVDVPEAVAQAISDFVDTFARTP